MNRTSKAGVVLIILSGLFISGFAYAKNEGEYLYRCTGSFSAYHTWGWHFDLNLNIYMKADGTVGGWDKVGIVGEMDGDPFSAEGTDAAVHLKVNEETKEIWYIAESGGHYVLIYMKDCGPAKTDLFTCQSIPTDNMFPWHPDAMTVEEAIELCDSMPDLSELYWWPQGSASPMVIYKGNINLKIY